MQIEKKKRSDVEQYNMQLGACMVLQMNKIIAQVFGFYLADCITFKCRKYILKIHFESDCSNKYLK